MNPEQLCPLSRRALLAGAACLLSGAARGGRTVRAVMHAALTVLDPFGPPTYITRNYGYLVFDTLFALDADNKPRPQMVESWRVSEDGLRYAFTLRPGLVFHDGAPVTAADVVASLRRWMSRDQMGKRLASVTARLDAVSEAGFDLALTRPYALVLETLAKPSAPVPFILPRRLVEIPETASITEIVGSGPFRFVASEHRPDHRVVFERFDGYMPRAEPPSGLAGGKDVKVDRVEWLEIGDPQTGFNALMSGEVHVMENVPADMMPLLRRNRGFTLKPRRFGNSLFLRFNSAQAPFDNPKVRQAVMAAIRQADYLDAQVGDAALEQPCNSVLSCESPWVAEVRGPEGDPVRARALLAESGYAGETVVILHPADIPALSAIGPVTEQVLREIGMNVRLDAMDWRSMLARRARNVPVPEGGWSVVPSILSNLDLMNPVVNPHLDASGPRGFAGWASDPAMEALRDTFAFEGDRARQQAVAAGLQRLSNENAFSIPLGGHQVVTGYSNDLRGVIADQILVFWNMELA